MDLKIDWQKVCLNIRSAGVPLSRAAKLCGSDWQHLNRLARGEVENPRWPTAIALLDLHYDICNEKHTMENLKK